MASSKVVLRTCFRLQRNAIHYGGLGQAHAAHKPRDAVVEIVPFDVNRGPLNNLAQEITKRTAIFREQIMFTSERLPEFLDSTALNCNPASSSKIQTIFLFQSNLQTVLVRKQPRRQRPHLLSKPPAHAKIVTTRRHRLDRVPTSGRTAFRWVK
jgi:hypothetical protein